MRQRMSTSMTADLATHGSVEAVLTEIDNQSKTDQQSDSSCMHNIAIGPFSVLCLRHEQRQRDPCSNSEIPLPGEHQPQQSPESAPLAIPPEGEATMTPQDSSAVAQTSENDPPENAAFLWNGSLQWDDLFDLGYNYILDLNEPLTEEPSDPMTGCFIDASDTPIVPANGLIMDAGVAADNDSATALPTYNALTLSDIAVHTPLLLKHWRDRVVQQTSAIPMDSKSPWEIVNLAIAIDAHARMTYLGNAGVTNAKQASLFSLLAVSSWFMAKNPEVEIHNDLRPESCDEVAQSLKTRAAQHLQISLRWECQGCSKAKYKDQLTAILNMMNLAVRFYPPLITMHADLEDKISSGSQSEVRRYMMEAEHLMRTRGLAKRDVSRKARLLHHVYTWCRIVGESTYVLHTHDVTHERSRPPPGNSQAPSGHCPTRPNHRLDDFLRLAPHFDPPSTPSSPLEDGRDYAETALKDIHLEDPRENPNSLYGLIYGISETWLRLLSQTTRLANQLDAHRDVGPSTIHDYLFPKFQWLENAICSFAASPPLTCPSSFPVAPHHHLHRALNAGLVIFFYRRIRDIHPWILQSHVDDVISALEAFDVALVECGLEGPGTVWPAFMAGCEAMSGQRREALLRWMERAEAKTSLRCYTSAKEVMVEVWEKRDRMENSQAPGGKEGASGWGKVCTERHIWVVAC